jgi:hypothetical protein
MNPVSRFLPAVQSFRDIHGEITACFTNQEGEAFHDLWWCLPLSVCGVRNKMV